jgi:hypothetical protein
MSDYSTDRRRKAKPKGPPVQFRPSQEAYDFACQLALQHGVSVNAIFRLAAERRRAERDALLAELRAAVELL